MDSGEHHPPRRGSRGIPLSEPEQEVPRPVPVSPVEQRDAYLFGAKLLREQPAACRIGYRLFWVVQRDVGWLDLEASSSTYGVLGYHGQCDLQLPKIAGVVNRHILASSFLLADGTPVLRLLDLHSGQPFTIEGQPRQSVCVSGPVLVGLGACTLGCVPLPDFHRQEPRQGGSLPGYELPPLSTSESLLPPEELKREADGTHRRTHVTILPRSRRLEDAVSGSRDSDDKRPLPSPPGHVRLTLLRKTRAVSVELAEADLYAGVVIGRSENCIDRGLRNVLSGQISRLHLLLLAERQRVYAMDLCSTNGTWVASRRVRRVALRDEGMRLVLSGNDSKVELVWHPRAGAET